MDQSLVDTYISRKLLEGVEHVEAMKVNNSCSQCVIVPTTKKVKETNREIPKLVK